VIEQIREHSDQCPYWFRNEMCDCICGLANDIEDEKEKSMKSAEQSAMATTTLIAGTVVTIGGIPLRLVNPAQVESHPVNIDLILKTEKMRGNKIYKAPGWI